MKLSKEELKQKIDELEISEDIKITLLEDIEDSMDVQDNSEIEELKAKYEELKTKYKERFLSGAPSEETEEPVEEVKEEEEIDVEEI